LHVLRGGRVGGYAQRPRRCRDPPGQLDVALAQPVDLVRLQPHGDARVPQVDVGVVVRGVGQWADQVNELDARREGSCAEVRTHAVRQHPPVLDTDGLWNRRGVIHSVMA
jgi:hypothetical protein